MEDGETEGPRRRHGWFHVCSTGKWLSQDLNPGLCLPDASPPSAVPGEASQMVPEIWMVAAFHAKSVQGREDEDEGDPASVSQFPT